MIKVQKPEEISFAFTAAGQEQLSTLSWGVGSQGKSFTPGWAQGGFLQAKPHPQPLNSEQ